MDSGTQTDPISIHSVDIETANVNSVHGSCQTLLDIANDIDKLYDGSIISDRAHSVQSVDQTNHETPDVESIDESLQIPVNRTNGSICKEGDTQQKSVTPQCSLTTPDQCSNSFIFDQNISTPYQSIPGKPFSDFSASELVKDMDFTKINGREVKYYGDYSYSYVNSILWPDGVLRCLKVRLTRILLQKSLGTP